MTGLVPVQVTRIAHASRQFDQASMPVPVTPPTSKEPKNAEKEARVRSPTLPVKAIGGAQLLDTSRNKQTFI